MILMNKATIIYENVKKMYLKTAHGKTKKSEIEYTKSFDRKKIKQFPLGDLFRHRLLTYCPNLNEIGDFIFPNSKNKII
jgi:hypothetical protein